jgi:phage FluMu gp28-like protein
MLGGPDWVRVSVPATECARIPKEHLEEEERRQAGMPWFRQEYMCEFVDSEANTFNRDLVERAVDRDVPVLNLRRLSNWEK